jgi:hypothetical protein
LDAGELDHGDCIRILDQLVVRRYLGSVGVVLWRKKWERYILFVEGWHQERRRWRVRSL